MPRQLRFWMGLSLACFATGCQTQPELTRDQVRTLIADSEGLAEPVNPDIVFVDVQFHPGPATKREILRVEAVSVKPDGPSGVSGYTATAAFTWQWNASPLSGRVFKSTARLHSSGQGWTVYDDYLKDQLWRAEAAEE